MIGREKMAEIPTNQAQGSGAFIPRGRGVRPMSDLYHALPGVEGPILSGHDDSADGFNVIQFRCNSQRIGAGG